MYKIVILFSNLKTLSCCSFLIKISPISCFQTQTIHYLVLKLSLKLPLITPFFIFYHAFLSLIQKNKSPPKITLSRTFPTSKSAQINQKKLPKSSIRLYPYSLKAFELWQRNTEFRHLIPSGLAPYPFSIHFPPRIWRLASTRELLLALPKAGHKRSAHSLLFVAGPSRATSVCASMQISPRFENFGSLLEAGVCAGGNRVVT